MKITVLDGYCLNPGDLSWDALRRFGEVEVFDRTRVDEVVGARRGRGHRPHQQDPAAGVRAARNCRSCATSACWPRATTSWMWRRRASRASWSANIPTYGTASVAQFVFALLLELCHNVKLHADAVRAG